MLTEQYIPPTLASTASVSGGAGRAQQFRSTTSSRVQRRHFDIVCDGASTAYQRLISLTEDSMVDAALASLEYNRATGRLSGSIAARNNVHLPLDVCVQYSLDNGQTFTDTQAQLLFGATGPAMDLDIYAFSLRTPSIAARFGRDPAQQIHLRVAAKVGGEILSLDDNGGSLYVCKVVPISAFALQL